MHCLYIYALSQTMLLCKIWKYFIVENKVHKVDLSVNTSYCLCCF